VNGRSSAATAGTARILALRTDGNRTTLDLEFASRERFEFEVSAPSNDDFPGRIGQWGIPIVVVIAAHGSWFDYWIILTGRLGPRRLTVNLPEALALVRGGVGPPKPPRPIPVLAPHRASTRFVQSARLRYAHVRVHAKLRKSRVYRPPARGWRAGLASVGRCGAARRVIVDACGKLIQYVADPAPRFMAVPTLVPRVTARPACPILRNSSHGST